MFEYFPGNYTWNMQVMAALGMGGQMSEMDEIMRPLMEASRRMDVAAQEAWFEGWKKMAQRIERLASEDEAAGRLLSAGRKYVRAGVYFLTAERMISHREQKRIETYQKGLDIFKKGVLFLKEPVEFVEVPFQGQSMPALFSKAPGSGKAPCVVHYNGLDSIKEFIYLSEAETFRKRGLSLLIVDHPGSGEALRLRDMHGHIDTEVSASACVDYLETREDVDPQRIGMAALSMGGYYAPRAAAFEKRFKCCAVLGAFWSLKDLRERVARDQDLEIMGRGHGESTSAPGSQEHFIWVFDIQSASDAERVFQEMTLEGVADKITCPLLVIHGQNDRQVPLDHARWTVEAAVSSPKKELKIFTPTEGGVEHCQLDNRTLGVDYMADWMAEVLGGDPKGV